MPYCNGGCGGLRAQPAPQLALGTDHCSLGQPRLNIPNRFFFYFYFLKPKARGVKLLPPSTPTPTTPQCRAPGVFGTGFSVPYLYNGVVQVLLYRSGAVPLQQKGTEGIETAQTQQGDPAGTPPTCCPPRLTLQSECVRCRGELMSLGVDERSPSAAEASEMMDGCREWQGLTRTAARQGRQQGVSSTPPGGRQSSGTDLPLCNLQLPVQKPRPHVKAGPSCKTPAPPV